MKAVQETGQHSFLEEGHQHHFLFEALPLISQIAARLKAAQGADGLQVSLRRHQKGLDARGLRQACAESKGVKRHRSLSEAGSGAVPEKCIGSFYEKQQSPQNDPVRAP